MIADTMMAGVVFLAGVAIGIAGTVVVAAIMVALDGGDDDLPRKPSIADTVDERE